MPFTDLFRPTPRAAIRSEVFHVFLFQGSVAADVAVFTGRDFDVREPDCRAGPDIDKDTKKITIKHGEIKNLDMPGMTMVFLVKDPAMLDTVKAGDKVKFTAEKAGGGISVTHIEVAK